jgi:hypothetical protein
MSARRRDEGYTAVEPEKLLGIHAISPRFRTSNRNLTLHGKQAIMPPFSFVVRRSKKLHLLAGPAPTWKQAFATLRLQTTPY